MNETKKCPACGKYPRRWMGEYQYDLHPTLKGSMNYYVGCDKHPEIMGQGKTAGIAIYNWERAISVWKMNHQSPNAPHWLGQRAS